MIRESALFSSAGCLSSQQAVRRNLMSPTVVIAACLMTRNVSETEGWQICICYNGHRSLVAPTEAHASSFLDGYETALFLFSYLFFFWWSLLIQFFPSFDLNNWWYRVKAPMAFVIFNCSRWRLTSHNPRAVPPHVVMIQLANEESVKLLPLDFFLVVLYLSGHFGSWVDASCKWFITTLN